MNNSFKIKILEVILILLTFCCINIFCIEFFSFFYKKYQKIHVYLYPINYLLPYLITFYIVSYFWMYHHNQSLILQFYKIPFKYIILYIILFCLCIYNTNLLINILYNYNSVFIKKLDIFFKINYNFSIKYYLESTKDSLKQILNYLYQYPISASITIGIISPIVEEILFRGIILQGLINSKYKKWNALIFTSFIFAILHVNFVQIISAFILGITIGWIFLDSKSLILSIILHIINNLGICLFYLIFKFNIYTYKKNSMLKNLILLVICTLISIFIILLIKRKKYKKL